MSPRVLCVAEKPSIAKALANSLSGGAFQSKRTKNKYIWNYELGYNSPVWGACELTVTAVSGHLTDIEFLPPFDDFNSEAVQLFSAPIRTKLTSQGRDIANNISQLSRTAAILYVWTDCDREGEHIGSEVVDVAKRVNSKIQIFRARFNNAEPSHLRMAANHPKYLDKHQVDAVNVRRELDLRTGFALTRLQTKLYRQVFRGEFLKRAVQYGSCQFPTLGFIVDRYQRIKEHTPEPFWTLSAAAKGEDSKCISLLSQRGRMFDRVSALCFYELALKSGNGLFKVIDVSSKPTVRYRPLPLTTVMLQKKASVALKLSAKRIMELAEKLYNEGFVSYPRTDTDSFDKSIDLKKIVQKQCGNNSPWSQYANSLLAEADSTFRPPRTGKRDDEAHPPIHPVQGANRSAFGNDNDKWRVYEFITRSFLACCSDDARGISQTITLRYGDDENFSVSGDRILERNFLDVYPYQKWTGVQLPSWQLGSEIECSSFLLKEGQTTPAKPLTESELVGLMDANGIGTDATMADHISNIQERNFVIKKGECFEPTPLGIALVKSYERIQLDMSLTKPYLRRETELEVSAVAEGRSSKAQALGKLVAKYENVFKQTQSRHIDWMNEAKRYLTP